jgi:hypothetical protein
MAHPAVRDNGDGTWTLADEHGHVDAGCWQIVPHDDGFRTFSRDDNFGAVGGRLWTQAECGWTR